MIEDEATVKHFYRDPKGVRLQPANDAYEPILTTEAHVLGKVTGSVPEGLTLSATATSERAAFAIEAPETVGLGAAPVRSATHPGRWAHARGRRPRRLGGAHRPGARGVLVCWGRCRQPAEGGSPTAAALELS